MIADAHRWSSSPRASRSTRWMTRTRSADSTPSVARVLAASASCWRPIIEERTGIETRATTLGHIQRGGTPSAYDRVLATRLGMAAMLSAVEGHWGRMVALRGTEIVHVPFEEALGKLKTVPDYRYEEARLFFG